ncbi:MAG: hypothetical protein RL376_1199 [Verrucomicrobiota bacterium]|jgi:glucosylceramidase
MKTLAHLSTTADAPWRLDAPLAVAPTASMPVVEFESKCPAQEMEGFGGCFNELGWHALQAATLAEQERVMRLLFDPQDGCRFNHCRMPIGANDFSTAWYSFNETRGDYEMRHFSIARDQQALIPFIRRARAIQPDLRLWASPWCPPTWMKESGIYSCISTNANWGQLQGSTNDDILAASRIRNEPRVLEAYALYFVKFVQSYATEGIPIYAVHPQNEVFASQVFPSCLWTAELMADFIADYLRPAFARAGLPTEVWFGTQNAGDESYTERIINDPRLRDTLPGAGFQWGSKGFLHRVKRRPDLKLMQTESECHNGSNSWFTAEETFRLLLTYISAGVGSYMYWNLILDQWGVSNWGWRQNSLFSIHNATGKVTVNHEFHVMRHFSAFVDCGARFLQCHRDGELGLIAFLNPDGRRVVVAGNTGETLLAPVFTIDGERFRATLPPHSLHTFVLDT